MGSFIEINDTLQITKEQGFPAELVYETHLLKPFTAEQFAGKIFSFKNKKDIRMYKLPPVRNFLVENIDGKWLYWGLVHIVEITYDTLQKVTSGKFTILYIYTPEEMKTAYKLIDRKAEQNFFNQ